MVVGAERKRCVVEILENRIDNKVLRETILNKFHSWSCVRGGS